MKATARAKKPTRQTYAAKAKATQDKSAMGAKREQPPSATVAAKMAQTAWSTVTKKTTAASSAKPKLAENAVVSAKQWSLL